MATLYRCVKCSNLLICQPMGQCVAIAAHGSSRKGLTLQSSSFSCLDSDSLLLLSNSCLNVLCLPALLCHLHISTADSTSAKHLICTSALTVPETKPPYGLVPSDSLESGISGRTCLLRTNWHDAAVLSGRSAADHNSHACSQAATISCNTSKT